MQEAGDAALQLDDPSEYIDYIKPFQNIRKDKVSIVGILTYFFTPAASVADLDLGWILIPLGQRIWIPNPGSVKLPWKSGNG